MLEVFSRVDVTPKAKELIDRLRKEHGEIIFHQSGGCCDGSAPMCFEVGDFMVGSRDIKMGEIHGLLILIPDGMKIVNWVKATGH